MAQSILRRLLAKTEIVKETGCWLFIGGKSELNGYGTIRFNKKKHKVHRISAHLFLDLDLGSTHQALHIHEVCPHKNCWNPLHLYVGTHHDNIQDNVRLGKLTRRSNL